MNGALSKLVAYSPTGVVHEMCENGIAPSFEVGGDAFPLAPRSFWASE